ncbi:inorganic diphosphatase [Buchnera aphidicola (Mindarus keteleerifoliae)]|uniref:inorganic diphosphatase n=1 Tax=Buchnera aphidicola TaxID=9 RepID=UPI0031B73E66
MNLNIIPSGKKIPENIYVIIEISSNSNPIKYEVNKKTGVLFVDRFIPTPMFYPCNYGYINKTKSEDGDPLDVLIPSPYPILEGSVILCRPVGLLKMIDENGKDNKIIAVPHEHITDIYNNIKDVDDISKDLKSKITHFFLHYKDLEPGKWVKNIQWCNQKEAKKEILFCLK